MYFRAQKKRAQDVSLSDVIEMGNDGSPLQLMDVIGGENDLMEKVESQETMHQLHRVLSECLTEQERQVIELRYGLSGLPPMRQREVAKCTGISRSYISRIEKRALQKLRIALE